MVNEISGLQEIFEDFHFDIDIYIFAAIEVR